jgi:hypothetical protein
MASKLKAPMSSQRVHGSSSRGFDAERLLRSLLVTGRTPAPTSSARIRRA